MSRIDGEITHEAAYNLRLRGLGSWDIFCSRDVRPWLENLARIMELKPGGSGASNRLYFLDAGLCIEDSNSGRLLCNGSLREVLPEEGWKLFEFPMFRLRMHEASADAVFEVWPGNDIFLNVIKMRLSLFPVYLRAQRYGGILLHAALVEKNRRGFLLAASSAGGKSTACRRLPSPWRVLSDDETLVVRGNGGEYHAHPFPTWSECLERACGRTWNMQEDVNLDALFFLEKSEIDEVVPMGPGHAASLIARSSQEALGMALSYLRHEDVAEIRKRVFENAISFARTLPVYILRLSPDGPYWEKMEEVLHGREQTGFRTTDDNRRGADTFLQD